MDFPYLYHFERSFTFLREEVAMLVRINPWAKSLAVLIVLMFMHYLILVITIGYRSRVNQRVYRAFDQFREVVALAGYGTESDSKYLSDVHHALEKSLSTPLLGWNMVLHHPEQIGMLSVERGYLPSSSTPLIHPSTDLTLTNLAETVNFAHDAIKLRHSTLKQLEVLREQNRLAIEQFQQTTGQVEMYKIAYEFPARVLQALIVVSEELTKNPGLEPVAKALSDLYTYLCGLTGQAPDQDELDEIIERALMQKVGQQYGIKLIP